MDCSYKLKWDTYSKVDDSELMMICSLITTYNIVVYPYNHIQQSFVSL